MPPSAIEAAALWSASSDLQHARWVRHTNKHCLSDYGGTLREGRLGNDLVAKELSSDQWIVESNLPIPET